MSDGGFDPPRPPGRGVDPGPRVRPMRPEDLAAAVQLDDRAAGERLTMAGLGRALGSATCVAVVGEDAQGGLQGFALGTSAAGELEITDVLVGAARRGRGLGGALLQALLCAAAAGGAVRALLEVRSSNRAARALYARAGFEVVGLRRGYYGQPPEDAVVMARGLHGLARS